MAVDFGKSLSQVLDSGLQSTEPVVPEDNSPNILTRNLSDVLGPSQKTLAQMQNSQDINSSFNAQNPTPLGRADGYSPERAGDRDIIDMEQNSAALLKGAPLTANQAAEVSTGVYPSVIGTEAQGNTLPLMTAPVAEPVQAAPTQTTDLNKIYNPFGGSQGLAGAGIDVAEKAANELSAAKLKFAENKIAIEQEQLKKSEDLQNAFDVKYQEKMDDLNANVQEYRQLAGSKVIPGAFLARQDTQASIMTGLAIAFGALGQGLQGPGSSNLGLEMINKAIDRDVEAQRFNLDTKVKLKGLEANANENLLSQMRQKFGDDKSAYLATKVSMLAMAEDEFNKRINQKGGAQDQMARANALQAKSQLAQQREVYEMQLRASQQEQFKMQEFLAGADKKKLSGEQAIALYGKNADKYVYGYGLAPSLGVAKRMQEKVVPIKETLNKIDDILSYSRTFNKLNPNDQKTMESKIRDLQLELKNANNYELGVLTGPDMSLLEAVTGNPGNFNPLINQSERLEKLRTKTRERYERKVKDLGFEPETSKINFNSN